MTTCVNIEFPWLGPYLILCKCHALKITLLLILFIVKGNSFFRHANPFSLSTATELWRVTYKCALYLLAVGISVYTINKKQQIQRSKWKVFQVAYLLLQKWWFWFNSKSFFHFDGGTGNWISHSLFQLLVFRICFFKLVFG